MNPDETLKDDISDGKIANRDSLDPGIMDELDFLSYCKREFQNDADARKRYDYEWMIRDMFRRGYMFSKYLPSSQTVILASRQKAQVPINITKAFMRSIRNQATSFRPKFEILPRYPGVESQVQARYAGRYLDYWYDVNKLKTKIKETMTQGLITSIGGPWEIFFDVNKKDVSMYLADPFDFYPDRFMDSGDLDESADHATLAIRTKLGVIRNNPEYNDIAIAEITSPESQLAVSEYKQFMIQALKTTLPGYDDAQNIILYRGYFRRYDPDTGKRYMQRVEWTKQNSRPLLFKREKHDEYPWEVYRADINPKELYGEGWMKDIMPINRVINKLESDVLEYNSRVAKGRILVDRDAGVSAIHNVNGEIITKNRGSQVTAMDIPALPISVPQQIDRMMLVAQDIGGIHDSTLGRNAPGSRSGDMVNALISADATNQQDLTDNLEDFLENVAIKVLKCAARNISKYQFIYDMGLNGKEEKAFAVVGDTAGGDLANKKKKQVKIGPDFVDLAILGEKNLVRVTIGSWLGYTKDVMEQKVMKLGEMGWIDQKTGLRLLEFGQIDDIIQQTRLEQVLQTNLASAQANQQNGQMTGQEDQYGLALSENEIMLQQGKLVPVDASEDHLVHIAVHQQALGQGQDKIIMEHIAKHEAFMMHGSSVQNNDKTRNAQIQQQGNNGPASPRVQQAAQMLPAIIGQMARARMQQGQPIMQGGQPPQGGPPPQGMPPPQGGQMPPQGGPPPQMPPQQ